MDSAEEKVKAVCNNWRNREDCSYDYSLRGGGCMNGTYVFECVWSKPTPSHPIPQHVVRVRFYVEEGDVTFSIEHNTSKLGLDIEFREEWFDDVIKLKEQAAADVALRSSLNG